MALQDVDLKAQKVRFWLRLVFEQNAEGAHPGRAWEGHEEFPGGNHCPVVVHLHTAADLKRQGMSFADREHQDPWMIDYEYEFPHTR